MLILDIIRLKWQLRTRRRRRSSLPLQRSAMCLCPLDSRLRRRLISAACRTVFINQIGRNVHAYVDDIVVKSRKEETLIDDLRETFDNLWVYKIMLNRPSVFLVYRQASFWVFLFQTEVSKLTQKKSRLLLPSLSQSVLMTSNARRVG